MTDLTPRAIVELLDRHIVGQAEAKRAVAVAVRNRWRRRQLDSELAREVIPRNIVMIGPTGVGKTEVARRLATLVKAPFVKVEATKFTEVGYVGRDVESMIRDLVEISIRMVRQEQADAVRGRAEIAAKDRLVSILLGDTEAAGSTDSSPAPTESPEADDPHERVRSRLREKLDQGLFDDREVEIVVKEKATIPIIGGAPDASDPTMGSMSSMLESIMPEKSHRRKVLVPRALEILIEQETEPLLDQERVLEQAMERAEQDGIVFIDEIDKIAASDSRQGGDVSRQGVQRDLLPIVEGSSVTTKHGVIRTDGILFVAAGAFHGVNVSDLMPELQGRFPIRVELDALTASEFKRILVEPEASLTEQQKRLLEAEGLEVVFTENAIDAMAELAAEANERLENIGARRLMTVIEQVFEEIAFDAPDMVQQGNTKVEIDGDFVRDRLERVLQNEDLGRFVL
ncbi:MAG: ATP-dependent protease ATPase subunit HslU [Phycisphaerales bacterium]|nr:ATP-dependent protease ATPase subunit HslU [Phycisphaerales bacterium]